MGTEADGRKIMAEFSPADVKAFHQRGNEMIRSRVPVPVCFNHDPAVKPAVTAAERERQKALAVAGEAVEYELAKDGTLFANVEVPDPMDALLVRRMKFTSPRIEPFTDGNARDWGRVITHLALTPRPVQHDQPPARELSLGAVQLSLDPYEGIDMAEEKTESGEGEGGAATIKDLIAALSAAGLTIPKEVETLDDLIIAVKASAGVGGKGGAGPADGTVESSEKPLMMSLETQQKKAEVIARGILKKRAADLFANGIVPKPISDALIRECDTVQLAFDDKGEVVPNAVTIRLESYEALPKGTTVTARQPDERRRQRDPRVEEVELSLSGVSRDPSDKELLEAWDKT